MVDLIDVLQGLKKQVEDINVAIDFVIKQLKGPEANEVDDESGDFVPCDCSDTDNHDEDCAAISKQASV